jgi:shikimate kinase
LTAAGGITEMVATLADRRSIYEECADFQVDTEHRTPAQVADAILAQLNPPVSSDPPP